MKLCLRIHGSKRAVGISIIGYSYNKSIGIEFFNMWIDKYENRQNLDKYCDVRRILKIYPFIVVNEVSLTHELVSLYEKKGNEIYDEFMLDGNFEKYRDLSRKLKENIRLGVEP